MKAHLNQFFKLQTFKQWVENLSFWLLWLFLPESFRLQFQESLKERLLQFKVLLGRSLRFVATLDAGYLYRFLRALAITKGVNKRIYWAVGVILMAPVMNYLYLLCDPSSGLPLSAETIAAVKAGRPLPGDVFYYVNFHYLLMTLGPALCSLLWFVGAFLLMYSRAAFAFCIPIGHELAKILWLVGARSDSEVNQPISLSLWAVGVLLAITLMVSGSYWIHRFFHGHQGHARRVKNIINAPGLTIEDIRKMSNPELDKLISF